FTQYLRQIQSHVTTDFDARRFDEFVAFARIGSGTHQRTALERVAPGGYNLEKLSRLDRLADAVANGRLTLEKAEKQVREVTAGADRWGPVTMILAFAVASAGAARFFGGEARDLAAAGVAGLSLGLLEILVVRCPEARRVFEVLAALVISITAAVAASFYGCSPSVVTLSGLIVLVPGLTLTIAMAELATQNLASGTARLTGALMTFFLIGFGVSLGSRAADFLPPSMTLPSVSLPPWSEPTAIVAVAFALVVLFRAHPRDTPWITAAGLIGFYGARLGGQFLGPELGTFVGGALVGIAGNAFARFLSRPSAVVSVPGIMLLVPGAVGYRSLMSLLEHETLLGIETAVTAAVVASALVTGLLVANVILPPRRPL
ncbi:MAG: threonine/serine exporter family protein, partial [Acidobacteriota bacterium]